MADEVIERGGVPVVVCNSGGAPIAGAQDALDVIGTAFSRAAVAAVPVSRFDERFFDLRTGLAGEVMQKFVNYRIRLVVVGDLSKQVAASIALRNLIAESNNGDHVWFVADLDELDARLRGRA